VRPLILAILQKMIDGDDALLELAIRRLARLGLGAELYPADVPELERLLALSPAPPLTAHLPRHLDVLAGDEGAVLAFAARGAGRLHGLTLHDLPALAHRRHEVLRGLQRLDLRLQTIPRAPMVFLEFAAGVHPELYTWLLQALAGCPRVSACLDVGHLGLWQAAASYAAMHPGESLFSLRGRPARLAEVLDDVRRATAAGCGRVVQTIAAVGPIGKPVHFHLHDGHPLWTGSPYGISDHLSFLAEVPLPAGVSGAPLPSLFGPAGLARIVGAALSAVGRERLSFTLELHPPPTGRAPLAPEEAPLFGHWRDLTNAERTSHWLLVLERNQALLTSLLGEGA